MIIIMSIGGVVVFSLIALSFWNLRRIKQNEASARKAARECIRMMEFDDHIF